MKRIITSLLAIFIAISSFSQENEFKLEDYKLPYIKRSSFDIAFDLSGSNRNTSFEGDLNQNKTEFDNSISLWYDFYKNSPSLQQNINSSIYVNSDLNKENWDDNNMDKKSNYAYTRIYFNTINRFYNQSKFFIETDLKFSYELANFNGEVGENQTKHRDHSINIFTPIKGGFGRIEEISDARHAIYIYRELEKVDRITENISDNKIYELAEIISDLKNERYFDFRLHRIHELEKVDSFLQANNLITNSDASYFATLTDIWQYGGISSRESGTRLSLAIYPGYRYDYDDYQSDINNDYKRKLNALTLYGGLEFKHEKPISLSWQNSILASAYYGLYQDKYKSLSDTSELKIPEIQINFFHKYGYYPNTRTNLHLFYYAQMIKQFDKTNEENNILGKDGTATRFGASFLLNYYISPKLNLEINAGIFYLWQESDENDNYAFRNPEDDYTFTKRIPSSTGLIYSGYNGYRYRDFNFNFNIRLVYKIF